MDGEAARSLINSRLAYVATETGRNIHIDGKTRDFYSQDGKLTNQDAALDRAIPIGRALPAERTRKQHGIGTVVVSRL